MFAMNCVETMKFAVSTPVESPGGSGEMSRLISAAIIDPGFCNLLLAEPSVALSQGYYGEMFDLSATEKRFVFSIQAQSLTDFAVLWMRYRDGYG